MFRGGSRPPTQERIRNFKRHVRCFNIDPHRSSRKVGEEGIGGTVEEAAPPCNLIGGTSSIRVFLARGVATTWTPASCSHCAGAHRGQVGRTADGSIGSWTMGGRRSLPAGLGGGGFSDVAACLAWPWLVRTQRFQLGLSAVMRIIILSMAPESQSADASSPRIRSFFARLRRFLGAA